MKYAVRTPDGLSESEGMDWLDGARDCMNHRQADMTRSQAYLDGYGRVYAEEQRVTQERINEQNRI